MNELMFSWGLILAVALGALFGVAGLMLSVRWFNHHNAPLGRMGRSR